MIPGITATPYNELEIIKLLNSDTIGAATALELQLLSQLDDQALAKLLDLDIEAFRALKSGYSAVSKALQERLILLISLYKQGEQTFESGEDFRNWLGQENFYFGGKAPFSYLSFVAGIRFAHSRLIGMEWGDNA